VTDHDHHHASLNPALEEARFCPRCAAPATIDFPRSLSCPACGYQWFSNPSPVAGAIPVEPDGRIWLLRRGIEPSKGLWTFPGGFVDLGESVEDAARREAREEIGIDLELTGLVGVYSRPTQRVVLIVYAAVPKGRPEVSEEATEVTAFAPDALPWDSLAFWSTEKALRDYLRSISSSTS
jgi:ADP-ribose pyrophosphatase YjhB (NUDIX family)